MHEVPPMVPNYNEMPRIDVSNLRIKGQTDSVWHAINNVPFPVPNREVPNPPPPPPPPEPRIDFSNLRIKGQTDSVWHAINKVPFPVPKKEVQNPPPPPP